MTFGLSEKFEVETDVVGEWPVPFCAKFATSAPHVDPTVDSTKWCYRHEYGHSLHHLCLMCVPAVRKELALATPLT